MSLDKQDEDDAAAELNGITYIAEPALLVTFGRKFSITLDGRGLFRVAAPERDASGEAGTFCLRPR